MINKNDAKLKTINYVMLFLFLLITLISLVRADYVSAQQTVGDQIIELKTGFNFVSFSAVPPVKISDFKKLSASIEDIYLYSAAAGSFLSAGEGTLTSLSTGKGYIIKSIADTSITINGPPAGAIGDITLKKGFNLLGFSKLSPGSSINTFTRLMKSSLAINGLYKWSAAAGSFLQVIRDSDGNIEMIDGSDPSLKPGEAYFINVSEDTKINYDDGVALHKTFSGLYCVPASDTVAPGGIYDLNKVKVYALYSEGSTVEVSAQAVFSNAAGELTNKTFIAPEYIGTETIKISYNEPESNIPKECYFTLHLSNSNSTPVKTSTYKCSYKLSEKTRIIDEKSIKTESVSDVQIVLSVTEESAAPNAGDILIGYHGDGYLRKATFVSYQSGRVYVSTVRASLEEAFETLDYAYKGKLSTLHATDSSAPGSIEEKAVGRFLRSKSIMPAPAPDKSIVSKEMLKKILDHANLSVTLTKADISFDPVIECDIEIGWFKLKKFLFIVGGDMVCGIAFQIDAMIASALPLKSELELFHSQPYVFSIGPVPFSFEWDINCGIDAVASVTGSYAYSNEWTFSVRVGAEYDGASWKKIKDIKRSSAAEDNYELKGAIEIKPFLNVGFVLKIVGLAGPKMYLEIFLSFLAEMASPEKVDITVSAGVSSNVSFVLELLSWTLAEFKAELFSISWTLYERNIDFYVPPPLISPQPDIYVDENTISISSTLENIIIKYTTDGSSPSLISGIVYESPFKINSSCTVKAVTIVKSSTGNPRASEVIEAAYTIVSADEPDLVKVKISTYPYGVPNNTSPYTIPYGFTKEEWQNSNFASEAPEYVYAIKRKKFSWSYYPISHDGWVFSGMTIVYGGSLGKNEDGVHYYTYPDSGNSLSIKAFYKRYNSNNEQMYPLTVICLPSKEYGSVDIANNTDNYYWPWGTKIDVTAKSAPGYIFNYLRCNMSSLGFRYDEKNTLETGSVDNTLKAYFSVKKSADIIYESPGTVEKHELLRSYYTGGSPALDNKYFGADDKSLSLKAVAKAGYKISRVDIDNGAGRYTFHGPLKPAASNIDVTRIPADSDLKIYIVTTAQ